ncbi:MAG: hypothetical protein D6706_11245 [Chloroflexi bacterium]|nr:MAG: hypothetical protein D6706_11245 [Chloroflexota bacterium]
MAQIKLTGVGYSGNTITVVVDSLQMLYDEYGNNNVDPSTLLPGDGAYLDGKLSMWIRLTAAPETV